MEFWLAIIVLAVIIVFIGWGLRGGPPRPSRSNETDNQKSADNYGTW